MFEQAELVDRNVLAQARVELGANFGRILSYFNEDGVASVRAIEMAMRDCNATAMVIPAHKLKGEAAQFGALPLSELAETIEQIARGCVETHEEPDEALEHVAHLRPMFENTLNLLSREANPVVARKPVFGRRSAAS